MSIRHYAAIDLGAESGRVVLGTLQGGRLRLDVAHRFPNEPVRLGDTLYWDFPGLWREIKRGLAALGARERAEGEAAVDGVGVDSWGVDFGLLDRRGQLLGNPVHYRDARLNGLPERFFAEVMPREALYAATGIQIMQINTLFQLWRLRLDGDPRLDAADRFLFIADLVTHFLCGAAPQEFTLASTGQLLDPATGDWSAAVTRKIGVPARLLPPIVPPGTVAGTLRDDVGAECGLAAAPVVAVAGHDTASAVVAVPAEGGDWAFLSSGTWSLMGAEISAPIVNDRSAALNFTNEGGAAGTYRFLKNIMGLWLVQECRRAWAREGRVFDYAELAGLAAAAPAFRSVVRPFGDRFLPPGDMPARLAAYCRATGQPAPETPGQFVRCALESLALAYRATLDELAELTGRTFRVLHIVGGGGQNRLLNQLAADATGLTVRAGPVEATAMGNCLQQAMALGHVGSLAEARAVARRSIDADEYLPSADRATWEAAYARFAALPE